jgi:hypothetical protein
LLSGRQQVDEEPPSSAGSRSQGQLAHGGGGPQLLLSGDRDRCGLLPVARERRPSTESIRWPLEYMVVERLLDLKGRTTIQQAKQSKRKLLATRSIKSRRLK